MKYFILYFEDILSLRMNFIPIDKSVVTSLLPSNFICIQLLVEIANEQQ